MDRADRLGKSVGRRVALVRISVLTAIALAAALPATHAQNAAGMDRQGHVRMIAPSIVTGPRIDPGGLERIAPRAPLGSSRIAPLQPQEVSPRAAGGASGGRATSLPSPTVDDDATMLFRPIASAAGWLEADGRSIAIAGVDIVDADKRCGTSAGGSWPCGMRARTAFRYWLRGRAVACDLEGARKIGGAQVAECNLAGEDVGAWLVDHGWALADPAGPYAEAGKAAREAGRGVFGGGRAENKR